MNLRLCYVPLSEAADIAEAILDAVNDAAEVHTAKEIVEAHIVYLLILFPQSKRLNYFVD